SRRKIVAPAAGMAQPLRCEQSGFAPPQLLFRLLARMNVCQQVVPANDVARCVAQRETARLKPPILAIGPADAVLEVVGQPGFNGVLPGSDRSGQVGWMHRVRRSPLPQVFERSAGILQHLTVDML